MLFLVGVNAHLVRDFYGLSLHDIGQVLSVSVWRGLYTVIRLLHMSWISLI